MKKIMQQTPESRPPSAKTRRSELLCSPSSSAFGGVSVSSLIKVESAPHVAALTFDDRLQNM